MVKIKGSATALKKHAKWVALLNYGVKLEFIDVDYDCSDVVDGHVFKTLNEYRIKDDQSDNLIFDGSVSVVKHDRVVELLEGAIEVRKERNAVYEDGHYGGAYIQHGYVMNALFPRGVEAKTPIEQNRLMNLNIIVGKLVRYSANFADGGHDDSMKDLAVYSQIQRELDEMYNANGASSN